jgi:hypothetical protein
VDVIARRTGVNERRARNCSDLLLLRLDIPRLLGSPLQVGTRRHTVEFGRFLDPAARTVRIGSRAGWLAAIRRETSCRSLGLSML